MERFRILLLLGSLRSQSINRRLALALSGFLNHRARVEWADIGALPHYNQDEEHSPGTPVVTFRAQLAESDAFLFVTPEYNRSIPGVLKNAIDHGSRPQGLNGWGGKPAAVIGATPGVLGTAMAQQHLRNILVGVNLLTMGQPEAYIHAKPGLLTETGEVNDESTRAFLQSWCASYLDWIENAGACRPAVPTSK